MNLTTRTFSTRELEPLLSTSIEKERGVVGGEREGEKERNRQQRESQKTERERRESASTKEREQHLCSQYINIPSMIHLEIKVLSIILKGCSAVPIGKPFE